MAEIEKLLTHPQVVGIGETGLDRYWDFAPLGFANRILSAAFEARVSIRVAIHHSLPGCRGRCHRRAPRVCRAPTLTRRDAQFLRERGIGGNLLGDGAASFVFGDADLSKERRVAGRSPGRFRWIACWSRRTPRIWCPRPSAARSNATNPPSWNTPPASWRKHTASPRKTWPGKPPKTPALCLASIFNPHASELLVQGRMEHGLNPARPPAATERNEPRIIRIARIKTKNNPAEQPPISER